MTKKILVTGGAGYLGSVLVTFLADQGKDVVVVDRFFFGETLPEHPRIHKIRLDTRALQPSHFADCDAVVDLAAISNDPAGDYFRDITWDINHRTRVRTARMARECGVSRYILPSSCSVYGRTEQIVTESSPVAPLTAYAKANYAAEQDIFPLASPTFCVTALRLATLYGYSSRLRLDLVANNMVFQGTQKQGRILVYGNGHQQRPLLHVADASAAVAAVLNAASDHINGEIINLGHPASNLGILDLAHRVRDVVRRTCGRTLPIDHQPGHDERSYKVAFDKASALLGFDPSVELETGLQRLLTTLRELNFQASERNHTLQWYQSLDARHDGPRYAPDKADLYEACTHG